MGRVVSLLVDVPVDSVFDYAVKDTNLVVGQRAKVDFAGHMRLGVVCSEERNGESKDLKPIISSLDEGGRWFSELDLVWLRSLAIKYWVGWGEMVFSAFPVELRSGRWDCFLSEEIRACRREGKVSRFGKDLPRFRRFALDFLKGRSFRVAMWIVESKVRVEELILSLKKEFSIPVFGYYQGIGRKRLKEIVSALNKGPILIVGTRQLAFWPMVRDEIIFVEDAWLDVYRQDVMPKYDLPSVLVERIKYSGGELVLHMVEPDPSSEVIAIQAKDHPLLPVFVEEEFYRVVQKGGRVAVFIVGKGYARVVRCNACKHVQSCPRCERPYTLVRREGEDVLYCPSCSNSFPWNGRCLECGSISVRLSSMGAERWEKILRDRFRMKIPIFNRWLDLNEYFDAVLIIGIDNVVAVDRFYSMPLAAKFVASATHKARRVYLRTRFTELADFSQVYTRWMKLARDLRLPPFGDLVILSLRSENKDEVKFKAQVLAEKLISLTVKIPGALVYGTYLPVERKKRDKYFWNIDLFLPKDLSDSDRQNLRQVILSFRKRYRTITSVLAYS